MPRSLAPSPNAGPSDGVWPCFVGFELRDNERVVALASWLADYGSNSSSLGVSASKFLQDRRRHRRNRRLLALRPFTPDQAMRQLALLE